MGKLLIVGVFSLALVWSAAKWFNVGQTAFALAGVPVSWAMLLFCGGMVVSYRMIKR